MISRYEQFSAVSSAIYRCIQKIERDEMVKYGYKGSFAQYLAAISHHPEGVTATQLCEICEKDKAAISRVIAEMEQKGLVVRRSDNESKYRARLFLTETGEGLAEIVSERARIAVDAVDSGMNAEERQNFYATLERINAHLQRIVRDGLPTDKRKE